MQQWVTKVGYGNQKIGDKADIDQFWLKGELRITPQAQIEFLRRLYRGDLPFSELSLLHKLANPLVQTFRERVMDFVKEFGFWVSGRLRGCFWFDNSDLEGLALRKGERSRGFEYACFVDDGEVWHGESHS